MRIETVMAWIFVGFGLLMIGMFLNMLEVNEDWGKFLTVVGVVYFAVGCVLAIVHDRHMAKRTRAGRERE